MLRDLKERFWEKVDKNGPVPEHCPELGACWVWIGATDPLGYGRIAVGSKTDDTKRAALAHRVANELQYGPLPRHVKVLHHCDNPPCCRGTHHFRGTMKDNTADMMRKRRNGAITKPEKVLRGERHGCAKLTEAKVREIRRLYALRDPRTGKRKWKQTQLAQRFHTDRTLISMIVLNKIWKGI